MRFRSFPQCFGATRASSSSCHALRFDCAMADVLATRKSCAQALRRAARLCSVPPERDDAGFERLQAFAAAIAASDGPEHAKASAREAFDAYQATWRREGAVGLPVVVVSQPVRQETTGFKLRGKSFLLTYNWDFLRTALPDGTPPPSSPGSLWRMWKRGAEDVSIVARHMR